MAQARGLAVAADKAGHRWLSTGKGETKPGRGVSRSSDGIRLALVALPLRALGMRPGTRSGLALFWRLVEGLGA